MGRDLLLDVARSVAERRLSHSDSSSRTILRSRRRMRPNAGARVADLLGSNSPPSGSTITSSAAMSLCRSRSPTSMQSADASGAREPAAQRDLPDLDPSADLTSCCAVSRGTLPISFEVQADRVSPFAGSGVRPPPDRLDLLVVVDRGGRRLLLGGQRGADEVLGLVCYDSRVSAREMSWCHRLLRLPV